MPTVISGRSGENWKKDIVLNTNCDVREKWDEFVKSILCLILTVISGKSGTNL